MPNTRRKSEKKAPRPVRKEPSLTRTKRLLNAALKVWELKHNIHEPRVIREGYE